MKAANVVAFDAQGEPEEKKPFKVTTDAVLAMRARPATKKDSKAIELFKPYEPMKGVLPSGVTGAGMAMDAGYDYNSVDALAALSNINDVFEQGYAFPGFTVLANWMQISEFRKPAEIYAREMTRKWIKVQATGDEDKSEKIKGIEDEFDRLNVKAKFREAIEQDGAYGRSQIFIDTGVGNSSDQSDRNELKTELVESSSKVGRNSIKRLVVIEPIWSYPNQYNANDPTDPTFYKPTSWFVMGKEIHSSRFLTIITRDVPDILKPAYAFAGLSLSQMIKPYVDNWLRARQSVSDLLHAFTVWTLKTDMSNILTAGGADSFFNRLSIFNLGRDNHGVNAVDMNTEEFSNVSAPLGSLDKLQAQAQEQMSAPSGIPLVYLTGITPSGLNATSEDEIKVFKDTCAANQEIYTPHVLKLLRLVQLSLFGEIDPAITFRWEPLYTLNEVETAALHKTQADTDALYVDLGALSPEEVRKRIAGEEDTPYAGLDLNAEIVPPADNPDEDVEMKQAARGGASIGSQTESEE